MCKIWIFTYTCDHELKVRHSECRGSVKIGPKSKTPACGRGHCLRLRATGACGSCQSTRASEALDLEEKALELRSAAEAILCARFQDERDRISKDIEARRDRLCKDFPSQSNWKAPVTSYLGQKPGEKSQAQRRRTSLLRREVQPSEVCGEARWTDDIDFVADSQSEDAGAKADSFGWDDWGTGYKTLSDEIDEDKASRIDDGLPDLCRDQNEDLEADQHREEVLSVVQHSCLEVDTEITTAEPSSIAVEEDDSQRPQSANKLGHVYPEIFTHSKQFDDNDSDPTSEHTNRAQPNPAQAFGPEACCGTTIYEPTYNTVAAIPPITPSTSEPDRPVPLLRTPVLSTAQTAIGVSQTAHLVESSQATQAVAPPTSVSRTEENVNIRMDRRQSGSRERVARRQVSRGSGRGSGRGKWVEDLSGCFDLVRVGS